MNTSSLSTGNSVVDSLYDVKIVGNIIPRSLFKVVKTECGKPDMLAVNILSDIIYQYRPSITYDSDGSVVSINKKFSADLLQKSYDDYADMFCVTKRSVKASFDTLRAAGFIKTDMRTEVLSGVRCSNVMYIELMPKTIEYLMGEGEIVSKDSHTSDKNDDRVSQKNVIPITQKRDTNTEINNNINNYNNIIPVIPADSRERMTDVEAYREILSENTELESVIAEQPYDEQRYREVFEIMVDYVCFNKAPLTVKGVSYPAEVVKKRMLQLSRDHLEYVLSVYDDYKGKIIDFKKHCAVTLFNSFYEVNNQINTMSRNFHPVAI